MSLFAPLEGNNLKTSFRGLVSLPLTLWNLCRSLTIKFKPSIVAQCLPIQTYETLPKGIYSNLGRTSFHLSGLNFSTSLSQKPLHWCMIFAISQPFRTNTGELPSTSPPRGRVVSLNNCHYWFIVFEFSLDKYLVDCSEGGRNKGIYSESLHNNATGIRQLF